MKTPRVCVYALALAAGLACSNQRSREASKPKPKPHEEPKVEVADDVDPVAELLGEPPVDPHSIVFADRTSQGYLLLLEGGAHKVPSREDLRKLVHAKLAKSIHEPEVELLLRMISLVPKAAPQDDSQPGTARATTDLLGLHVEMIPLEGVIAPHVFQDPVLTRELDSEQRAGLAGRTHALLLRADYRNQYAVRGLRLLQTLVHLVAQERGALVFDPDTEETLSVPAFVRRRLQSSLGNIADQVAVVPFPDRRHEGKIRLSTRGMRRFGSVDLELDGLPRDPQVLQRATDLLYGLSYKMMLVGEFDARGYAVELGDTISIERADVRRAYSSHAMSLDACEGCVDEVEVHLVERAAEDHDPPNHMTARVVAPRSQSDDQAYDQAAWALETVTALMGS